MSQENYKKEMEEREDLSRKLLSLAKFLYTLLSLIIISILSNLPLNGYHNTTRADPFYWMRGILASKRGTMMELGIIPRIVSQLLHRLYFPELDINLPNYLQLVDNGRILFGIEFILVSAFAYVCSGMCGSISEIGVENAVNIFTQLCVAGVVVVSVDEYLSRGHGLVSGVFIFIASNILLDPMAVNPIFALLSVLFMLSAHALKSKTWIENSWASIRDPFKKFKERIVKSGHQMSNIQKEEFNGDIA